MEFKYKEEPDLGKVVKSTKPFCKLTKGMDVPSERFVLGDFNYLLEYPGLAGKKWSRLCGFTFTANDGHNFQIVFVPKLRGTLARNQQALSGWYCWDVLSDGSRKVISIPYVMKNFKFNINKFFFTDYFDKWVSIFQENCRYAVNNQLKIFVDDSENSDNYNENVRYVNAIKDSIDKMTDVKQFISKAEIDYLDNNEDKIDSDDYEVKLAYNAHGTYKLPNLDKTRQEDLKSQKQQMANKLKSYRRADHEA